MSKVVIDTPLALIKNNEERDIEGIDPRGKSDSDTEIDDDDDSLPSDSV